MSRVVPCARTIARALAGCGLALALTLPSSSLAGNGEWNTLGRVAGAFTIPLPENYHARLDGTSAANKAGGPVVRTVATPKELAAEAALAAKVPELRVARDELTQLPVMVLSYAPGGVLARARKASSTPEQAARAFLAENSALYGASSEDLATLRARYTTSPEGGATIVKFDQVVDGLTVFGDELAVALTKGNDVVATSGRIYPQVGAAAGASARFGLLAPDAIIRAVKDLTGRDTEIADFELVDGAASGDYEIYGYRPDRGATTRVFGQDVRVKRVLFPLGPASFLPGYYLELWVQGDPAGSGPVFSYVVGAEDGRVLFRNDLKQYDAYTYRVYADGSGDYRPWDGPTGTVGTPHPTGTPNGYQAPFILAPLVSIESLLGSTDPWLPPAATVTTGNNTEAYLDLGGNDGFDGSDVRGNATGPGVFDVQYDSNANCDTASNRQSSVIGMFYQVNWLHDIWYQRGFTEAAGNAQSDNYGRGGVAGDSLRAEGQDFSGTDNANMSTPADGGRPVMQMYKFTANGRLSPTRDGTFDMLIVGHEMGHYISNRLIGNANGLTNKQGRGMGEGWGDFNCVLTTVQDTDNVETGTYAVGGQTDKYFCSLNFVDNYYYSIRRYPYSVDRLKNPLTFKDISSAITTYPGVSSNPCLSPTSSPSEVHNTGEIWAQMQWDVFGGLARAYGVGAARNKMMQYFVDGMKLTPTNPTFTEARDAYLAAVNAANGDANPKDSQILWKAFAKRGIGTNAVSPARTSNNNAGVVEDFTAAPGLPDDTVGIYTAGTFFERDVHFGGNADQVFSFGAGGLTPLVGNWDGSTGVGAGSADNPGLYDPSSGAFFLRNSNTPGAADLVFTFGPAGAVPVVGDWDGNGSTTVGIYIPATGAFFLKNSNSAGVADLVFTFGPTSSTFVPIVGDWNGDGIDTVGLYDPATGNYFLKNSNSSGPADLVFGFGVGGGVPLAGDWNSDGVDTVGFYSASTGVFFLRNQNAGGVADEVIGFGPTNAVPVAGNFDGQ